MKDHSSKESKLETELSREMGLFSVTMIGVGAMIGAGIFVLTGIAAGHAGPALIVAFALNGVVTLFSGMSYAELGSTFPEAGGGYMWVKDGLGGLNGFQAGWMSWYAHAIACSLYILGFGYYFLEALKFIGIEHIVENFMHTYLPGLEIQVVVAVGIALIFGYINYKGASETGMAGVIISILKVTILGMFIVAGLIAIFKKPDWVSSYKPFFPEGFGGVLGAMGLTYIAFEGYEIIVQSGEEVKDPGKNLPKAVFIAILIVVPIYIMVGFTAIGSVIPDSGMTPWDYLAKHKEGAMVEAAKHLVYMPWGYFLMILGGLFATMSALNATIYSSSRVAFAMGRDRNLPDMFSKIHSEKRTPHMAVWLSVALIILMAVTLPVEDVAAGADIMFILLFFQVNIAIIALRKKRANVERPFKVPFFPWPPIIAIILEMTLAVYLYHLSAIAWITSIAWVLGGVIIYYAYARNREIERAEEEIIYEEKVPTEADFRVLVPLAHPEHIDDLIDVASSIAKDKGGEIIATGVVTVPSQLPLAEGRRYTDDFKEILEKAAERGEKNDVVTNTLIKVGREVNTAIHDIIRDRDIDLMMMGWKGFSNTRESILGGIVDDVVENAECDVAMIKMVQMERMNSILLPTSGGPHATYAATIARGVAEYYNSTVNVVMVTPPGTNEETREKYRERINETVKYLEENLGTDKVKGRLIEGKSISSGILKETEKFDACIMGAAREGLMQQIVFGSIPERVAKNSRHTVIMTKKHQGPVDNLLSRFFRRSFKRVGKK